LQIEYANVTRLCHTKRIVSVNGLYPGPTLHVTEGDHVAVNVTNLVPYDVTIHW
jgi:laccase